MRLYLFIFLTVVELCSATVETLSVGEKPFAIVHDSYNEYGTKATILKLYKGEEAKPNSRVLVFVLKKRNGPCSARGRESGAYEVNASTITFFTSWKRDSGAYSEPMGARITRYEVLANSDLKLLSSKIYIESTRKGFDKESGMQYLFNPARTKEEKSAFAEYIEEMEDKYKGEFVFGDEKQKLFNQVNAALKRKMKSAWGH